MYVEGFSYDEFPVEDLGGILCLLLKGGTEIMPTYGCKEPSHSYTPHDLHRFGSL